MDEDKRILAVLDQPLPTGYSRWSNKLIAKATNVDLRYVQDSGSRRRIYTTSW